METHVQVWMLRPTLFKKRAMMAVFAVVVNFTTVNTAEALSFDTSTSGSRSWLLSSSAAAKEAKRFTLQSWLENKDRRALMDMWLAINTPTPYELIIGGSLQSYSFDTTSLGTTNSRSISGYHGDVSAFARFVGLSFEHQNNIEEGFNDTTGIFNLRVFGDSQQTSHITVHYGLRTRTANDRSYRLNQPFPAVSLQLYLMKFFGIQGHYRSFGTVNDGFYGELTADELTYGAFIEYGILRIFGDVYQERQNSKLNGVETDIDRKGTRIGLKFFF
jgi:hypothetical protein